METTTVNPMTPRPRPDMLVGATVKIMTAHGALYLTVNRDDTDQPFEVFATLGRAGGCEGAFVEAIGRLVSLALRSGVAHEELIKQLAGIRCGHQHGEGADAVLSGADAIAKGMQRVLKGTT